jgi:hypothetical protein
MPLQHLEVWPPSKGLCLPSKFPQCLFKKIHMVLLCNVILFHFDVALLGLLGSDACQFLLCCLFVGVFCLLFFPHELILQSADVVIGFIDFLL